MRRIPFAAAIFAGALVCGQSAEFDVASFKLSPPADGDQININLGTARNGTVTLTNVTLSECVMFAYGIPSGSLISGPDWIRSRSVRFDVLAKAPPGTDRDTLTRMFQSLLADRLDLKSHQEQKTLPYLALVAGKNGSKMKPASPSEFNPATYGHIARNQITMPLLATLLSRFERQTIVDETGLKGSFRIDLNWVPDPQRATSPADIASGPSLYTAVQEQLGLKLESRKGPVSVLVIDSALQTPKPN